MASENVKNSRFKWSLLIGGAGIGLADGLAIRLAARFVVGDHAVMTIGFILFMPLALGFSILNLSIERPTPFAKYPML